MAVDLQEAGQVVLAILAIILILCHQSLIIMMLQAVVSTRTFFKSLLSLSDRVVSFPLRPV